ncbi:MAG: YdbH domain-containing protein [Parvularculaceae bacterium]
MSRFLLGLLGVLVIAAATLFFARAPIVEFAARQVLSRAGLDRPNAEFGSISLSQLSFQRVSAGDNPDNPDIALEGVVLDYDWRPFFFNGKTRKISARTGKVRIVVDEKGGISTAGWKPNPDAPPTPPSYRALSLGDISLVLAMPGGDAVAKVTGEFSADEGGHFRITAAAAETGIAGASLKPASLEADIALENDGAIKATGEFAGDIATSVGAARGAKVKFDAGLTSWRRYFETGELRFSGASNFSVEKASIAAEEAPLITAFLNTGAPSIRSLAVNGDFAASFSDGAIEVAEGDKPFVIRADRGDALTIRPVDNAPLYSAKDGEQRINLKAALSGAAASGEVVIGAISANRNDWRIKAGADVGEQEIAGVKIAATSGDFDGTYGAERLSGVADLKTHIKDAKIGRFVLSDMPADARLALDLDLNNKMMTAQTVDGECVKADRGNLNIPSQDMSARIARASFCSNGAPVARVDFGADKRAHLEGVLSAKTLNYRLGRTKLDGAPPKIAFNLDYLPDDEKTTATGAIEGGDSILSETFRLSGAKGKFEGSFIGDKLAASADLSSMRIAQAAKSPFVAPVSVAGDATLKDDRISFDFNVATPDGVRLGEGDGVHDVSTGKGAATFDATGLSFTRRGLQPGKLIPVLVGAIVDATGSATGEATFKWTPGDISSQATVNLNNLAFGGPVRAITRTEGVSGTLHFSSLAPMATDGDQTISIGKMQIDALQLENGSMTFSLPGDETLKIPQAEFPWFGGTMGVYGGDLALTGTKAETEFQIANVNLKSLLDFVAIDGLSGEGTIEGVLPISFENGRSFINNGILSAKGGGVVRYTGQAAAATEQAGGNAQLAFEALRELRFDTLSATIDGPLDGRLDFKILFEGRSLIPVQAGGKTQRVDSPVKYRVTIDAPLLSLLQQAILSTNVKVQFERARANAAQGEEGSQ